VQLGGGQQTSLHALSSGERALCGYLTSGALAAACRQLQSKVDGFVLRRTQHLLAKHLPPLAVHTVFCRPSQLQVSIYRHMLRSESLRSLLHGSGAGFDSVLPVITAIRKLCNHPDLLAAGAAADEADEAAAGCTTSNDMLGISSSKVSSSWLSAETRNFERGMLVSAS
jgi:SNF2 family DNA or RNA helicase